LVLWCDFRRAGEEDAGECLHEREATPKNRGSHEPNALSIAAPSTVTNIPGTFATVWPVA
jgi:hypothetical protein